MRAEEPGGAVEREQLRALLAPGPEIGPQQLVAPEPVQPARHLRHVIRIEQEAGVAHDVGETGSCRGRDREPGVEGLADRQAPALEPARKDEGRSELIEAAELQRADEAGEGGRLGEAEALDLLPDAPIVARPPAGADKWHEGAGLIPDTRERLEQALVVLVRPGLRRIEQERLRKRESRAEPIEVRRGGGGVLAKHRPAGHDRDLLGSQAVALDEVPPAPRGHGDDELGSLAVGAVDGLASRTLPIAEELRQ